MPSKLNSEFNYRYQVQGETVWEKIKTLKGFLEGRERAAALEAVGELKARAKLAELVHVKDSGGLPHVVMTLEADILEMQSHEAITKQAFELNRQEIVILNRLLAECFVIAEPTRVVGYTDEQMFELNAANEFTAMIGKEIHAEIIANGRPSPSKIRNAMSNPYTWAALKAIGLIPKESMLLESSNNPLQIELKPLHVDPVEPLVLVEEL